MADSYVIVEGQNLLGLQNQINNMLAQGYQPLSGTFAQVNNKFYQGMANLTGVPVPFGNVTGISDLFRQMSAINDKDLLRQAVGSLFLGYNHDNAKPGDWQPTADEIEGISDLVRMLLKTSTKPGMRDVIGAGTSNLTIGYGADEAKPGDWKPDVSDISGASQVIEALLESNNEAGARAAIGAGTSNLKTGAGATDAKPGDWLPKNTDIQGLSVTLIALLAATDAATARTAIGAGTSNLTVGTDSSQAKAGNWQPKAADVSDITNSAVLSLLRYSGTALSDAQQMALRAMIGAGTIYSNATGTAAGLMSAADKQRLDNIATPVATVIGAAGRPVGTAFTLDSARWADVTYSFSATLAATLTAAQNVQVDAQIDGVTVARLAMGITLSLAVAIGLTLPFTNSMTFRVPPGKQLKFVVTGTTSVVVTVACGQETLI